MGKGRVMNGPLYSSLSRGNARPFPLLRGRACFSTTYRIPQTLRWTGTTAPRHPWTADRRTAPSPRGADHGTVHGWRGVSVGHTADSGLDSVDGVLRAADQRARATRSVGMLRTAGDHADHGAVGRGRGREPCTRLVAARTDGGGGHDTSMGCKRPARPVRTTWTRTHTGDRRTWTRARPQDRRQTTLSRARARLRLGTYLQRISDC